jgi:cobyrinic acid a,c-diamide synthase
VDLDQIFEIARGADELEDETNARHSACSKAVARIGVARDEAFNFYYQDNIELMEDCGAEVVPFSPIHDSSLPNGLNGLFLGGGFPEVFVNKLEENEGMRRNVKKAIEDGMPVYAECGSLMYLTKSLFDMEGNSHQMVGVLDARTIMGRKLESLNYTLVHVIRENVLTPVGFALRGHEFHYSKIEDIPADAKFAYDMKIGKGISNGKDGWTQHNLLASYMHIHFAYNPQIAQNFVSACENYERK